MLRNLSLSNLSSTLSADRVFEWVLPSRSMRRTLWPVVFGAGYIAVISFLGGLRADHVGVALLALLDLYNEKTRSFLRLFFPFILTGVVYDSMRYFYWQGIQGRIHVAGPYYRDLRWFGVGEGPGHHHLLTLNEYFRSHTWIVADLLCGLAYLTYVAEYLLVSIYLYFSGHWRLLQMFGWQFFTVNILGFITYFVYPAAPPWYVARYGVSQALMHIEPCSAAASRFDQILGTHFFEGLYGRGVDVYGAYPSLHVTYPLLVCWICFQVPELKSLRMLAGSFFLLMCFSAVYLQHHYVVDILLGITYVATTLHFFSVLGGAT
jgi:inositol phosphorylceramide synthase catalytic subunit